MRSCISCWAMAVLIWFGALGALLRLYHENGTAGVLRSVVAGVLIIIVVSALIINAKREL